MRIGELCNRELVSVSAETPLSEVARLMCERHVGAVVVTKSPIDAPVAVGIITDRDITGAQLRSGSELQRLESGRVMTREPLILCEDEPLEEALGRLRRRGVRRAPVVTAHGMLVGLVSVDDVIAQLARELVALARVLHLQPARESWRDHSASATITKGNVISLRYPSDRTP